jgi:UDP-N-acetylmuramate--alanine ligase
MAEGVARLVEDARPGDMVLTLGAGSISQAGPMLLEALRNRE